ncbi:IS110 family transposase [Bradyrhizobium erythrophlei]|uniref:IS110 family transposase n=1 Tax=Bradyrhizobium erythrophlei TaxID=1437360 RepID=UPI0035ECE3D5
MQSISTIGLDIAKSVFQVHGVDAAGQVVIRRQLRRRHVLAFFQKLPPCLVGIEACASSHHWARAAARACLAALGSQLRALKAQILEFDRRLIAWHRSSATSKRLDAIPGVGPALATALVASVADAKAFRSGRDFSAWVGLVPKQNSSGGKDKLGSISKQGDRYLRSLFTAGALAVIRYAKIHGTLHRPWLTALLARRPTKVAAIALANKLARMAWAMMARNERYKEPAALTA